MRIGSRRVRVRRSALEAFIAAGETAAASDTDDQSPASAELADAGASLWERLDAALAESRAALADDDQAALVGSLNSLADGARSIAAALGERGPGSAS